MTCQNIKKLTVCKVENLIDLEVGFVTNQYCSQCDRVCVLSRRWCRLQFASNTNHVLKEPGASFMQHSLGWMFTNSALLCMQSCGSDPLIDFSSRMRVYVCVRDGVENKCMPTSRYWPREDWGVGRGKDGAALGLAAPWDYACGLHVKIEMLGVQHTGCFAESWVTYFVINVATLKQVHSSRSSGDTKF